MILMENKCTLVANHLPLCSTLIYVGTNAYLSHFIDVTKGASSHRVLDHPAFSIGVTADIVGNDDEIAIAAETFFGTINRQSGKHRVLKEFWGDGPQAESKAKERRMNDGNVDVQGRQVTVLRLGS